MIKIEYSPDPVPHTMSNWGQVVGNISNPEEVDANSVGFDAGFVILYKDKTVVKVIPSQRVKLMSKV